MSHTAFDPRSDIISTIGFTRYVDGVDRSTVSVENKYGDKVFIPLLLPGEARTGDLPRLPMIEVNLMSSPHSTINIGGDVKYQEAYIDFNIYYTHTSDIEPATFGVSVADELCNLITSKRNNLPIGMYMEVINSGREIIEQQDGKQVVFHRVVEVKCVNIE